MSWNYPSIHKVIVYKPFGLYSFYTNKFSITVGFRLNEANEHKNQQSPNSPYIISDGSIMPSNSLMLFVISFILLNL